MNMHQTMLEFRAGGTDLSERRRSGVSRGQIVDLTPTDTMTGIAWGSDGAARIGAMVTIETLASDARVRNAYWASPVLLPVWPRHRSAALGRWAETWPSDRDAGTSAIRILLA